MANVSADLTWALVRNTSSFLKTNKADGAVFSTEPMNLTGKNSFKYSGLANASAIGMHKKGNHVEVTTKKRRFANKPSKNIAVHTLTTNVRRSARSIQKITTDSFYRPDLQKAATARFAALTRKAGKGPKKVSARGNRQ